MPAMLSDSDIYPPHPSPQGRLSLRELKIGSLDRHSSFIMSPSELFSESKLVRAANTSCSMTSLSTPSFRAARGQQDELGLKGPCYMGLCLPGQLDLIFGIESPSKEEGLSLSPQMEELRQDLHSEPSCLRCLLKPAQFKTTSEQEEQEDEQAELDGAIEGGIAELVESLTTSQGPTASVVVPESAATQNQKATAVTTKRGRVRIEILRLVSNLISCVGAKANEQALLRLKAQFPAAFQNLCTYSEVCALMSRYNLRSALRRFIQELFFDLAYVDFYAVAAEIFYQPNAEPTCLPHNSNKEPSHKNNATTSSSKAALALSNLTNKTTAEQATSPPPQPIIEGRPPIRIGFKPIAAATAHKSISEEDPAAELQLRPDCSISLPTNVAARRLGAKAEFIDLK